MKNRVFALLLLLFVMAALPLSVVRCDRGALFAATSDSAVSASEEEISRSGDTEDKREQAVAYAASLCESDFCEEALRAAVILANTNLKAAEKLDFNSDTELKSKIASIYFSGRELSKDSDTFYIPSSPLSGGNTETDSDHPYLCAVASPWDCEDADYNKESTCVGVSMRGVDYLCRHGCSAEEALLHYLPGFSISS